ncbi:hypothetical protein IAT38_007436 [Cryptococcus sp. DSM 104549]
MPPTAQSPWQRRFRRLFFFVGTASTFYILSSYILDRMRESRLKAIKEKKQRELMKNHFTSLISTISFTLYALLPTLQPQVFDAYPVESTSQALQGISVTSLSDSTSSVETGAGNGDGEGSGTTAPENSLHLYGQNNGGGEQAHPTQSEEKKTHEGEAMEHASPTVSASSGTGTGVGESWASEFQRREEASGDETTENETEAESEIMVGSSVGNFETDDGMSSIVSQSISLPPTDISSTSPSPPSDLSHSAMLHQSPPRAPAPRSSPVTTKSKKELWKDLKIQSITRTITTAYLLPMLYLLTSSQLSVLARNRYLQDIQSNLAEASKAKDIPARRPVGYEDDEGYHTPRRNTSEATLSGLGAESTQKQKQKRGWFSSFSVEAMGLSEFVEGSTSLLPNPVGLLPERVTNYLPAFIVPSSSGENQSVRTGEIRAEEAEAQRRQEEEEAERLFLTYSWWLLHEGWKGVAERVDGAVEKVFGSMPLKRQLSVHDWERALKEVRAEVEMDLTEENELKLHDFTSNIIPSSPPTSLPIPFPLQPKDHSAHLASLVRETLSHLQSPDGRYILEKGVSAMIKNLTESLAEECYGSPGEDETRRLAECLPEISKWGKGVWEGVPDSGIEEMLAVPEFEGFSALIFGDWASK